MLQAFQADGPEGWETEQELCEPEGRRQNMVRHPTGSPASAPTLKASVAAPAQKGWESDTTSFATKVTGLHPELCREIINYVPSLEDQAATVDIHNKHVPIAELEE